MSDFQHLDPLTLYSYFEIIDLYQFLYVSSNNKLKIIITESTIPSPNLYNIYHD